MPILEANMVKKVRPFLVIILVKESFKAVAKLIFVRRGWKLSESRTVCSGLESVKILPSEKLIIRSAYCFANWGLWVTIITKRS